MRTALLCLTAALPAASLLAQDPPVPSLDRVQALAQLGLSSDAARDGELTTASYHLRTLGVTVHSAKWTDAKGEVRHAAWTNDGASADLSALRRAEIEARRRTPSAKLHVRLADLLTTTEVTRDLPIMVWLDHPADAWEARVREIVGAQDDPTRTHDEHDAREAAVSEFVTNACTALTTSRASELEQLGYRVRFAATGTPALALTASADEILRLAALPFVDTIYLDSDDKKDHDEDANATHRTTRVHERGVVGRGVDVAILENNRIDENHPWLQNAVAWFDLAGSAPDSHVQSTAGCVASQQQGRIGAAFGANLHSANAASYSDSDLTLAADWITSNGAIDFTNGSFGPSSPSSALDYTDRMFDFKARVFLDSYVMSAGNTGNGTSVGNRGWNIVTVGAHTGTGDYGNWDNDVLSTFSATGDPATGCEKPNLTAVGEDIDTLGDAPTWTANGVSGTSFSAPFVTGNLADALQVDVTMSTPEAAMAALMATAWHNIDGATRLSDNDGAGGLHGWALVNAARRGQVTWTNLGTTSFNNNGYHTIDVFLRGGDKTRIAIAWSSNANVGYTTDILDADLDLAVFAGSGQTSGTSFGFSSSFNDNFEIVEFVPPVTGTYTVRINDFRFDGTTERVGLAWTQKTVDTNVSRLMERNRADVDPLRTGPTLGERYWLDVNAPHSPNTMFVCLPGLPNQGGTPIGSETWLPLVPDPLWTTLWFDNLATQAWPWRGYDGTTNANGENYLNRLDPLFSFPFLQGYDITHVALLLDPSYPDGIREITQPRTMEFWPQADAITTLSLDDSFEVPLPFSFTFYGVSYDSVFVNANGNLTFGGGDTDWSESQAEMLSEEPRIALFWDDLDSRTEGTVARRSIVAWGERSVVIDFVEVPQFNVTGDANTGRVILYADGRIRLQWGECDLVDGLVGISPGGDLSSASSLDLTEHGFFESTGAIYELFSTSNPFDLGGGLWKNDIGFIPDGSSYRLELQLDR
jgi:hypothetical protein